MKTDARRRLPSVDVVVRAAGELDVPRERFVAAVRDVLAKARTEGGAGADAAEVARAAREQLAARDERSMRRVLNATGVVLQTNLGRAPLAPDAIAAIADAAGSVSVEYDLAAGQRGERHGHASALLRELSGAEDGVVVNNNAAAVLLALAALAARREVLVSRGELVEIGGGFRIPDVLQRSGAKLVEVGTTNRTYVKDYAAAIGERTAAILRVHASNFKVVGFTARPEDRSLAALAHERGIAFIHDLGSGTFLDTSRCGLPHEGTVAEAIAAGADVVTFSGDKLLGGPQAGLAVGRASAIAALRTHPLMRALRPDKLTIAALVATLELYRDGRAAAELPVWRMLAATTGDLERRARAIVERLARAGVACEVVDTSSTVGGGSLPEETQPSRAIAIAPAAGTPASVAARLRRSRPPVVSRILDGRVALDLRAILPEDDERLVESAMQSLAK
jgi:L-seryl-tRNA(Ser) seleniumtransferase